MPQFLSRARDWFAARSRRQKAGIIVLAFIGVLTASRVLAGVAGLVFFAVVVVLIAQLFRRRPVKKWAIAAVGSLAAVVLFSGISGAIYGPQTGQGDRVEERAEKPPQQEPVRTKSEEAKPPPKEPAEKPEANKQPEPDPKEHLVTADEYHQLYASADDDIEEYSLKRGLNDCINAKYKDMYGEDAWNEIVLRADVLGPYRSDAHEVLMIREGAGCTVQEGIDQLGNWTSAEWRATNRHFEDGL